MRFWKFLGIWPGYDSSGYYSYYSKIFIFVFIVAYVSLCSINFYFLPRQLDLFIEEMIFYFTELSVSSKALTFVFMRTELIELLNMLESEMFQPDDEIGMSIIQKAKSFNFAYWKIVAGVSITSNMIHVLSPLLAHLLQSVDLVFPVCSYSFLTDEFKQNYIYLIYFYQSYGMHIHMLYNLNVDTFFLGLMTYAIAQLDILDYKLRRVTDASTIEDENGGTVTEIDRNTESIKKINKCIIHFDEVNK